jgi:hypothetical protein
VDDARAAEAQPSAPLTRLEPGQCRSGRYEHGLDRLGNILRSFNEQFGTLFTDSDGVAQRIRDDIAPKVAADAADQNAKENTPHTARMAHDQAPAKVMQHLLKEGRLLTVRSSPGRRMKVFGDNRFSKKGPGASPASA